MTYEMHEYANLFPRLAGGELAELRASIREHGLLTSIVLYGGKVLDGRHRYEACQQEGITPRFEEFKGSDEEALAFVIAMNATRRHLTASQRAALAVRLLPIYEAQAKERQRASGGDRKSEQAKSVFQKIGKPIDEEVHSHKQAAQAMNVNHAYVSEAKRLQERAPELLQRVEAGELSLQEAKRSLEKPHVANNSGENEWYTPPRLIEAARRAMGSIDCDPASSSIANEIVQAKEFFTSETNGLAQKWWGNVWMNPPYAQPLIQQFTDALIERLIRGEFFQACVLVNNATETTWGQSLLKRCLAVCLLERRVRFLDPSGSATGAPLQGQMVLYFAQDGSLVNNFAEQFKNQGVVLTHGTGRYSQ